MTSFQLAGFRIFKLCFVDSFNPETQISHQQLNSVSWVEEVCQIWGRCCARGLDNERTLVGQKRLNSWAAYLYQRPDPIVGAVYLSSHWNHYFIALTSLVLHIAHKPDVYFLLFVRILIIMTKVSFLCQFILDPGPTIVLPCLKLDHWVNA